MAACHSARMRVRVPPLPTKSPRRRETVGRLPDETRDPQVDRLCQKWPARSACTGLGSLTTSAGGLLEGNAQADAHERLSKAKG